MELNIISVLCEGPHDVAFITKIFKSTGFKSNETLKIDQFPSPINQLILTEIAKTDVKNLNIQELRYSIIPSATLQKESTYLFLYSLGGDTKTEARQKFLGDLLALVPKEGEISIAPDANLGVLYFFDSDNKGVAIRVEELNVEIQKVVGKKPFKNHLETHLVDGLKIGCLIFTNDDNNFGKLEDILIPLMKTQNDSIFEDAETYLRKHFSEERSKKNYDSKKSTIGIVGQLQKSGSSNVVCIGQTDYINNEKIDANQKCVEIIKYFNTYLES